MKDTPELQDILECRVLWTKSLFGRGKRQFIRSLAEVESYFLVNDLRSAYQTLTKVNSKPSLQATEFRSVENGKAADICGIPVELLNAGGEPTAWSSHIILAAILQPDRILVLRIIVECHREFEYELLEAYIGIKKALDMVYQESLWEILRLRGIPTRIIGLTVSILVLKMVVSVMGACQASFLSF
ncbi:uncharacterized protein [Penaeus vannamei]|uniref:uncharacterized protein n=1 Tax=Penaeus vannamei TaxID=6689 RepID=UPI00387F53B6